MKVKVPLGIKIIITFHMLSAILWTIGQGGAVLFYDTIAGWGFQDPRENLAPGLVEVNKGIGLSDFVIQIPLFIIAIVGLWRMKFFVAIASWMVFGISLYWPCVYWFSQYFHQIEGIKHSPAEPIDHILLAFIFLFSVWGSWYQYRKRQSFI
jgi:hypothetical protein